MATTGIAHRFGTDVSDLREIVGRPGPFLTVYLCTEGGVENAAARSAARWKALRQRLTAEGVPGGILDAVEPLVPDAHREGPTLVVVADESGTLLVDHLDERQPDDRATWAAQPDLVPLLHRRQSNPPHLLVWADHGGADVISVRGGRIEAEDVAGDGDPERKVAPGGWSQARYQRRAEDDWAHTAVAVAETVRRCGDLVEPRLVVLGGDVQATTLVRERLPQKLADRTHVIEQGRATDGSDQARDEEVRRLVATAVAEDTVAVLEAVREELGQHDRGVEGIGAVRQALERGAVDLLLVPDSGPDQQIDALLWGAMATGASVRVVPRAGPLTDGVGALLRWPSDQL